MYTTYYAHTPTFPSHRSVLASDSSYLKFIFHRYLKLEIDVYTVVESEFRCKGNPWMTVGKLLKLCRYCKIDQGISHRVSELLV